MKTVTLFKARQGIMESIPFGSSIVDIVSTMNDIYEMDCYMTEDDMVLVKNANGESEHSNGDILLDPESFIEAVKHSIRASSAEDIAEYYSYLTGKSYIPYKELGESDEHPETVLIMSNWTNK